MIITLDQLQKISGRDLKTLEPLIQPLNDTLVKYSITTPLRVCHFLAQVLHESGCFKYRKENLNYSAEALLRVFPKYFDATSAKLYEHKEEMIANKVYANRMGNGPSSTGESFKYIGRGFLQLTGKNNASAISKDFGVEFVKNPALLEQDNYVFASAGWYWNNSKLNNWADKDDVTTVTKLINGGTNGLADRKKYLDIAKKIIMN